MADGPVTQPTANAPIPRVRDPQFREVYANTCFTGLSPFDVTLTFAKTTDMAGQALQVDQVSVTVSPQHFKALCRSLNQTMEAYEKVFGNLQIPDSDTAPTVSSEQIEKLIVQNRDKARANAAAAIAAATSSPTSVPSSTAKKRLSKRSRGGDQE